MKRELLELKKKIIAFALTTTMSINFCGCTSGGDIDSMLSGTSLEDAFLASIDDEFMVVKTYQHNQHIH